MNIATNFDFLSNVVDKCRLNQTAFVMPFFMPWVWEKYMHPVQCCIGNHIPQNYYAQILHSFIVTEADFAILKAQLKYEVEGEEPFLHTKHYRIERADVEEDINILLKKEKEFDLMVKTNTRPNTVLPEI